MTTNAEMITALGITESQITKALAYLDRVSPKTEADGITARANAIDDFKDHIVAHYNGIIKSDLKQQIADPDWD